MSTAVAPGVAGTPTKKETGTNDKNPLTAGNESNSNETNDSDTHNGITLTLPPSHILEDGRLIYLPPPNALERSRFFERSIARHGLLQADMETNDETATNTDTNNSEKNDANESKQKSLLEGTTEQQEETTDKTAPKIHPLAVASARLQSLGLNELNRAINLSTLVETGEYFSFINVVDPSYKNDATTVKVATTANAAVASKDGGGPNSQQHLLEDTTTAKTEALFSLKRKRLQFQNASEVLSRHEKRLYAGIQAQKIIDGRLFELRKQWRLVAPEHGTRARLHAARTNEVIAVDVDVYDRDRVHGGNQALMGGNRSKIGLAGRLASRVPRFATIELRDTYRVPERKEDNDENEFNDDDKKSDNDDAANNTKKSPARDVEMNDADEEDTENNAKENKTNNLDTNNKSDGDVVMRDSTLEENNVDKQAFFDSKDAKDESHAAKWTRAEPFAVADPTLGRVIENFDPSKIPMLNLQLEIQKSSTGFLQSACLEPMTTISKDNNENTNNKNGLEDTSIHNNDEDLLISLQHSLFCANLFESMRSELDPDSSSATTTGGGRNGPNSFSARRPRTSQSMAWLASESEENFVAPPSYLVGNNAGRGLGALSVVHCHDGEVKVQLDSEYQLCLKLIEANAEQSVQSKSQSQKTKQQDVCSGSQSPAQLHAFCRALLLYAQDVYHRHSLYLHEREKKMRQDELAKGDAPRGLARIKKEDLPEKARILQSCVSLGAKMLFEQRIRKAMSRVSKWLQTKYEERFTVEWLALSMFDLHSKFTICCRQLVVDGIVSRDTLTMTKVTDDTEDYRKVHFRTEIEFELYLKLELKRQMQ